MRRFVVLALFGMLISGRVHAEVIQFPTEELATESVLPVFDQPTSVRNRVVSLSRRIEIGALMGYALTEPFYSPFQFGGTLSYHIDEKHGINIFGSSFMEGLSSEAKQLNPIPNSGPPPVYANLQYGPAPKSLLIGSYQYSAYYGKLSLTKDYVMNLHLYGLLGIGMIGLGDASKPVLAVGIGQKFHFSPSIAFRFDLRLLGYQGPDPTSIRLDNKNSVQPSSAFYEKVFIEGLLNVGLSFMFPAF
ncbi:MAG: outer membrane beta-barrel domain-containing protein [Bdellovibrionales bacterium]|jgi:outer membrane beta-barrel protein|nr:outer membrane beta-barrel domain-containing protein [Bdellovibrionales bacterium]